VKEGGKGGEGWIVGGDVRALSLPKLVSSGDCSRNTLE